MSRLLKQTWWLLCFVAGLQTASAFSLLGPREPYQVVALGYGGNFLYQPHNLGEEFRYNIPTLYYAFDETFLDYFGSNGVHAVDTAMDMLSGVLSTNVSSWSPDLSEFPLNTSHYNYAASAMHLFDMKSAVFGLMVEQLGLADPELFTWTLRVRVATPTCPSMTYRVIKRNFDPITYEPTSYVNGNLFTYTIIELCPTVDQADAVEFLVDPVGGQYGSAVASFALDYGLFYSGITRDDAGGLRHLYRANNINMESAGASTFTFLTNTVSELLVSSNLTLLAAQAVTNTAAALQAIYPNLVILQSTNYWTNVVVETVTAYYTNIPTQPAYFPPQLVFATNRVLTVETRFHHLFGNLAGIEFRDGRWVTYPIVDLNNHTGRVINTFLNVVVTNYSSPVVPAYLAPLVTNVTRSSFATNGIVGEFIILPTNACDLAIIAPQLAFTNSYTNLLMQSTNFANTNIATSTNIINATNFANMSYTRYLIDYSTNHAFIANQIFCPTSNVALRQGIERVQFVRRDYDSLLGRYWYPITNVYKVMSLTNNMLVEQTIQRIVTQPDISFSALDSADGLGIFIAARTEPNWDTNGVLPGVFGPGSIQPPVSITFNKVGPIYRNFGPFFMDEATASLDFIWASFDGTTNAPVVYPSGVSLENLENQILMPVTATETLSGTYLGPTNFFSLSVGSEYKYQFAAAGGRPPYTWSLAPGSPNLPPGFVPADAGGFFPAGIIEGTPTAPGKYSFTLRMMDSAARFVDRVYILQIK